MKNPRKKLLEIFLYHLEAYGGKLNPKDSFAGLEFDINNWVKEHATLLEPIDEKELEKFIDDFIMKGSYSDLRQTRPIAHAIATKFGVSKIEPIDEK